MATFKTIIETTPGVMVDFYMDRCPPCEMLKPKFASMAAGNTNEKIAFVKVNGPNCRDMYDFAKPANERGGFPTVVTFLFNEKKRCIIGADMSAIEKALGEMYQMLDSKSTSHLSMKFK
jgi:thiol-disulfide isomerase/thioredoxin